MITLEEMKSYLRVDFDDDDALIENLISGAEELCMDVSRVESVEDIADTEKFRVAVLYAVAYLYEHREEADHHQLTLTLRSLLFAQHEGGF